MLSKKPHGNTGKVAWNKGKTDTPPRSEEVKKRISSGMKGKSTVWLKGRTLTKKVKDKISVANSGKKRPWVKGWPKGKPHSLETRSKTSGKNNYNWKGGKRSITLKVREMYEYRQWWSDIYTRDDFTCQICGIRGAKLNADHYPKMLSVILDEYSIKTKEEALVCSELWNINNGRTLCESCHRKTPTWGLKLKKTI